MMAFPHCQCSAEKRNLSTNNEYGNLDRDFPSRRVAHLHRYINDRWKASQLLQNEWTAGMLAVATP
jgi:hypothetical protein